MEILKQVTYQGGALRRNCRGVRKAEEGARQRRHFSRIRLLLTLQGAPACALHHTGCPAQRQRGPDVVPHISQSLGSTGHAGQGVWREGLCYR